jgi:hypothetical protein
MGGFEPKLAFHLLNERPTSNRDRFGPTIIAHREAILQPLLDPLAMCSLKISQSRESTQTRSTCKSMMTQRFGGLLDLAKTLFFHFSG